MPELTRDRLPDLQNRSPRFFASWLLVGLEGFLLDGRGRSAFPGAANHVGWETAIEEDLARIYSVLLPHERSDFRLGVRIALGEARPEQGRWLPLVVALLRLAALIGAVEMLDLPPALLNAAADMSDPEKEEACRTMFDVVVELSLPTDAALTSLRALIGSPGFRPAVAGSALIALTRAEPGGLPRHLGLLSAALDDRFVVQIAATADEYVIEERDELIVQLAALAPLPALVEAFDPLARHADGAAAAWLLSDWFTNGIVTSSDDRVRSLLGRILDWAQLSVAEARPIHGLRQPLSAHRPEESLDDGHRLEPWSWRTEEEDDECALESA